MKTILTATAVAALALGGYSASAETPRLTATERSEARLAEMLEGRVAGEPQSCITAFRTNRLEVIENVGLVYKAGDTIWVARASNPRSLSRHDVPVIQRSSSQLCKQDVIRTVDRHSHFISGAVFLENFVPYTKQDG